MDQNLQQLPFLLLPWYRKNARDLPWRRDKEPYHVWLSEIMLQQTRVEAVKGYYARFLAALPSLEALAAAPEETVLKLWEGLGYYSRARNLQKAAIAVMEEHAGKFPEEHAAIRTLPGIGDYTAGAIASICFEAPTPAIDGNVLRILARITAREESIDLPAVKKDFHALLAGLYPPGSCGDFTQSLMELGACICTPRSPGCDSCPVSGICLAREKGLQRELPLRSPKKARRIEKRTVFAFLKEDRLAIQKRPEKGLLAGLFELPSTEGHLTAEEALQKARDFGLAPIDMDKTLEHIHIFSHVEWHMRCHFIRCSRENEAFLWADPEARQERFALPSAFRPFLQALENPKKV